MKLKVLISFVVLLVLIQFVPFGKNHSKPAGDERTDLGLTGGRHNCSHAPVEIVTATRRSGPGIATTPRSPGWLPTTSTKDGNISMFPCGIRREKTKGMKPPKRLKKEKCRPGFTSFPILKPNCQIRRQQHSSRGWKRLSDVSTEPLHHPPSPLRHMAAPQPGCRRGRIRYLFQPAGCMLTQ